MTPFGSCQAYTGRLIRCASKILFNCQNGATLMINASLNNAPYSSFHKKHSNEESLFSIAQCATIYTVPQYFHEQDIFVTDEDIVIYQHD